MLDRHLAGELLLGFSHAHGLFVWKPTSLALQACLTSCACTQLAAMPLHWHKTNDRGTICMASRHDAGLLLHILALLKMVLHVTQKGAATPVHAFFALPMLYGETIPIWILSILIKMPALYLFNVLEAFFGVCGVWSNLVFSTPDSTGDERKMQAQAGSQH